MSLIVVPKLLSMAWIRLTPVTYALVSDVSASVIKGVRASSVFCSVCSRKIGYGGCSGGGLDGGTSSGLTSVCKGYRYRSRVVLIIVNIIVVQICIKAKYVV